MKENRAVIAKTAARNLVFLLVLASSAISLHGQEKSEVPLRKEQDIKALATQYLELRNMKASVDEGVQRIVDNLALQFPNANKTKLYEILDEAIGWGAMSDKLLELATETYTAEELRPLIDFYSSPAGKAAQLKGEHFSSEYNKILMIAYNEALGKMSEDMFEPTSKTVRGVGDEVRWTEYKKIDSDDCVSIPFVGRTCHTVKYKFEFRGRIASVDSEGETYDVLLSSASVVPQEFVSAMYWTYKDRAQAWADRQQRRSIEFKYVN